MVLLSPLHPLRPLLPVVLLSLLHSSMCPVLQVVLFRLMQRPCSPSMNVSPVCQLCEGANFLYEQDFGRHKKHCHGGEAEYRKRVLYLMERQGYRKITARRREESCRT